MTIPVIARLKTFCIKNLFAPPLDSPYITRGTPLPNERQRSGRVDDDKYSKAGFASGTT